MNRSYANIHEKKRQSSSSQCVCNSSGSSEKGLLFPVIEVQPSLLLLLVTLVILHDEDDDDCIFTAWTNSMRKLLRFSTVVHNSGNADFRPVLARGQWEWHQCHQWVCTLLITRHLVGVALSCTYPVVAVTLSCMHHIVDIVLSCTLNIVGESLHVYYTFNIGLGFVLFFF